MKKYLVIVIVSSLVLITASFSTGFFVAKKRYSPKQTSGEIYIDYTEDDKHPSLYLNNLNPSIFNNNSKFLILGLNHIRK